MIRRCARIGIVASTLAIATAYATAFFPAPAVWAPWLFSAGTAGILVAMMVLGATRQDHLGRLAWPFVFVFCVLAGGLGLLLALPAVDPANPELWAGLPPRAAILLYVVGILPMFVVPVAYALTFDELTLSEADWARIREAAAEAPNGRDEGTGG